MEIETIDIDELTPYQNNAKEHPAGQIEQIKESIKKYGNNDPIAVWGKENIIVEGHGRYIALKELGRTEAEIIRLDHLTDEERKEYTLVHNKLTMNTDYDFEMLRSELDSLEDFDAEFYGFEEMLNELDEPTEITEDEAPENPETRCKLGDIWQLGNHRLICGNSTDISVIDRLMDGVKAKLLLTDPPYGVKAVESGGHNDGKKAGKQMCRDNVYMPVIGDDTTDTARANYDVALTCTENQIIFGGNYFTDFLPPSRCWIVWDKKVAGSFADGELAWTSFDRNLKIYEFMWSGMRRQGDRTVEGKTRVHPTQKPVGMLADILKDFSEENDSILDCFGGSGSTLIACEQLNRKCYMAELDPHYCDVIIERYENLTGKKAVLING